MTIINIFVVSVYCSNISSRFLIYSLPASNPTVLTGERHTSLSCVLFFLWRDICFIAIPSEGDEEKVEAQNEKKRIEMLTSYSILIPSFFLFSFIFLASPSGHVSCAAFLILLSKNCLLILVPSLFFLLCPFAVDLLSNFCLLQENDA